MAFADMEDHYSHWRLVEGCIVKILPPSYNDMWYVNYLWISRYERPKIPPIAKMVGCTGVSAIIIFSI